MVSHEVRYDPRLASGFLSFCAYELGISTRPILYAVHMHLPSYRADQARCGYVALRCNLLLLKCLRSFALSCAAISLRILLPLLSLVFSFETSYALVAWLSWSINLVIVETYLYYTYTRAKAPIIGSLAP